jgi:hypothetical protein
VVDAIPLNNKEIQSSLQLFPIEAQEEVQNIFRGVNGYTVAKEKLLCPDDDVLPKELRGGPRGVGPAVAHPVRQEV